MSSLLKEVGAVAGLASFLGLALLALLYFAQARDLRRLRQNARFLVEGNGEGEPVAPAERTAAAVASTTKHPEEAAAAAAATAPNEAEAFRRAELARQAAERRQRFERRRRGSNGGGGGGGRPSWLSEPTSIAVIVVGAILLVAGVAFGVTRLTGGSSESTTPAASKSKGPCPPGQTRVAVLNGTATPGLAAQSAGQLKQRQYKVGPVGNTSTPFTTSVVMYDPTDGRQCAPIIGQIVGIQKTQAMNNEVRQAAEGNPVAVVLGDDKAGESGATGASATTGSGI
jgi:LytR cell envelope-related transcriptional attenuator